VDLTVTFLGTGGSAPTARRSTASVLVARGGDRLMFDCGEGTQRQLQRSLGLVQVDDLYLTHFHADHFLGLPGMLKTFTLRGRAVPLDIHGPRGLRALMTDLRRIYGKLSYDVRLIELAPNEAVELDGYRVGAYAVEHGTEALGYALVEDERPGRFDPARASELGVEPGPQFGLLQRGQAVEANGRTVHPHDVMGEARPGRKIVVTGDTLPCDSTVAIAHEAELLVHDGTFAEDEVERARQTGHATARQAAEVARAAEVSMLALTHLSSRYFAPVIEKEAREVFEPTIVPRDFDVIEVPYPERGEPVAMSLREHRERTRPTRC
jgi:ribonuclease Z